MANQGGNTIAELDSTSLEKRQVGDTIQGHASTYASLTISHLPPPLPPPRPPTGSATAASWSLQLTGVGSTENVIPTNSIYYQNQETGSTVSGNAQEGLNAAASQVSTYSLGAANGQQEYGSYTSYPTSTDPYGYSNTGYQGYYYGYQQQSNHSYSQQGGAYQNSGAPYQPLTSFQNTGSYVGPTSYSGTYYNTGDYQTTGGYQNSSYSSQTNLWNDGNYGSYPLHNYSSYAPSDSNGTHSSSTAAPTPGNYEQQYKQWAQYYSQPVTDVSCAPGTETVSVTTASSLDCPVPGDSAGYTIPSSQPPPPGTTVWRPDTGSSQLPLFQTSAAIGDNHDGYWKKEDPGFQNQYLNQASSCFQKPLGSNPLPYDSCGDQHKTVCPQGPHSQYPGTHQVPQNFHTPLQTVPTLDTQRVSKLQIPTNPRITSTFTLVPQSEKDISTTSAAPKPAYISVSMPKSNDVSSNDATDAMLKPGRFPPSLRAYVERALARCKDDTQKAACQDIMKEIITKASADGTLFTRNWDTEPLFPLPNAMVDTVNKGNIQSSVTVSSLPKYKRSPSRRSKSRWEPIPEEKIVENLPSVNNDPVKDATWDRFRERDKAAPPGKCESKDGWSKFLPSQQRILPYNSAQKSVKKQRLCDGLNATENGDASSDSDKEQGLTAYYSSALALANSPEEKKKRENRFKRFEKGHGNRAEIKHFRPKVVEAGNLHTRRASAQLLNKNFEGDCIRAVEDMDWDALTVKGTCQEIEKRYLRLTSAPDPATVRPEEVLEKALLMVQNSQKNYLYKCDQLKSIRQDLTVQRIHNELTVKVYETHARLALEAGDLPEYNQCQSQLKNLYAEGINGCYMEFSAYNLLCVILHSNNYRDLVSSMARLSAEAKKDEAVKHALAVRAAVTSGNYILFFRLYKTAPNLNTCLMDLYVEKMRFEAVKCMSRSYRPTVPVAFIAQVLGFTSVILTEGTTEKDMDGLEECEEWLKAHGATLTADNNGEMQLDTKVSSSSLYMPEPEDAVSHGDSTLAVNDFLTRTA